MTCTIDALVEMLHKWHESIDVTGNFVRVLFLDYSKAQRKNRRHYVKARVSQWGRFQGTLSRPKHVLLLVGGGVRANRVGK